MHFHRHARFYIAGLTGVAAFVASRGEPAALRLVLAGDLFFVSYLVLMAAFALRITPDSLRRRGEEGDEGLAAIFLLAVVVVGCSLGGIFVILNHPEEFSPLPALLAVASVPLGWATLHTLAAFHYATMYYAPNRGAAADADQRGLEFPRTDAPGIIEFLYFSFTLGMAAQVSDVVVCSTRMRRAVLVHSACSFFYNTVLLALGVNAALTFAGGAELGR